MARIMKVAFTEKFDNLTKAQLSVRENDDCGVKAIAVVCDVSYAEAHIAMAKQGREKGKATSMAAIHEAIRSLGFKVERVWPDEFISKYPKAHQILKSVTTHHPRRFNKVWKDGNNYLMYTDGHVSAIADGTMHDHAINKALRATHVYKVSK